MNISIITVGKVKEVFYQDAVKEFQKRLSKYCKLVIVEVADEMTPAKASSLEEEQIKDREAERILKNVKESMFVVALAIEGKQSSSVAFAQKLNDYMISGKSDVCFIIGGSLGLGKKVYDRSNELISFSKMTFPHQLMRVILLEQIYRGYRIINHEPYHK